MIKKIAYTFFALIICAPVFCQMKLGSNTTTLNGGSILELESTSQGLYLPRVSLSGAVTTWTLSGTAPSGSANGGMMVYNTNSAFSFGAGLYYWDGTKWVFFIKASGNSSDAWLTIGNSGTTAGANFIGTTDAVDWMVKTNATERLRVTSSGDVVIGANDNTTSAVGGTFRASNKTGTNATGPDLSFYCGNGTGTGGSGNIIFYSAPVSSTSGSTANTYKERMRVTNDGSVNINTSINIAPNDLLGSLGSSQFIYPINGYANTSDGIGVYASNTNTSGIAVEGFQGKTATTIFNNIYVSGAGGAFYGTNYGSYGESYKYGVYGYTDSTVVNSAGVMGVYSSATYGYLGGLDASSHEIGAFGSGTTTGVVGVGNGNTSYSFYSGAGGSFYGSALGVYGSYNGTSYYGAGLFGVGLGGSSTLPSNTDAGVVGNVGTSATYAAGVAGYMGTMSAPPALTGVFGSTSSSSYYGVYSYGTLAANLSSTAPSGIANTAIVIKDGHLQTQQTTAPTRTNGSTTIIGTTGSATLSNATDIAGKISLSVSGTAPTAAGTMFTITFNKTYNTAPIVLLMPTNANAATAMVNNQFFVTPGTSNFTVSDVVKLNNNTYTFNYFVIEPK